MDRYESNQYGEAFEKMIRFSEADQNLRSTTIPAGEGPANPW